MRFRTTSVVAFAATLFAAAPALAQADQPVRICTALGADRKNCADKPPKAIKRVEPNYTAAARKAKYQGVVVLECVVATDGRVHDVKVSRSSGRDDLDEKGIEAVKQWEFEPGRQHQKPVPTIINVEVNFHLY